MPTSTQPTHVAEMALFSQELFEVFEEKSEPVSLTGKKRRRADAQGEKKREADPKKSRVADNEEEGTSSDHPMVIEEEVSSNVIQQPSETLSGVQEGESKEEAM